MLGNGKSIIDENLVEFITKRNEAQSAAFCNPAAQMARRLYRGQHPTEIQITKCMDGRLNLALYTETPQGILQPMRNVGGKFDFGWPFFQEVVRDSVNYAICRGRQNILMTSYHFSKGDHHRGCAGFGYDTEEAKVSAFRLREQATRVFGELPGRPVYALTIGIETDEESLIFHGAGDTELRVADLDETVEESVIFERLRQLYPDMHSRMIADLMPLVIGNRRHITALRESDREPIDLLHREQIIGVGRGFDWLHMPNTALIIGPYSHEWPKAVATAGTIIKQNIEEGRIPAEQGFLLLVAALHREEEGEAGRRLKQEKVKYLFRTAHDALVENVPDLMPHMKVLGGVVNADTRKLDPIDLAA